MSNPWGRLSGIGSWAAEAEREEHEEREQAAAAAAAAPPPPTTGNGDPQSFPSLKEAVSTKSKKKKMPLSEFITGGSSGLGAASRNTGLTPNEMLQLPTGPKQRSPDEYGGGRLGGGFSGYGRRDASDTDGSWGGGGRRSYGGFEDDRRGTPRRGPDFENLPSRADEVDDWGAGKRAMPPPPSTGMDTGRVNRYGALGGGSRADEVDNWARSKPVHSAPPPVGRSNTFGSGVRDSGFDSDRWRRGEDNKESDSGSGRRRLVLDPPRSERSLNEHLPPQLPVAQTNKPNPFGLARPREEILAEKGLDWKKIDLEIETKKSAGSRPTSSHGSRPSSAQSGRSESTGLEVGSEVAVKPKVNPFGAAKPREVVLEEKGKDWRKIDLELEHRGVDREETEEEKALKEEIENLKKELEKQPVNDPSEEHEADQSSLRDLIQIKERELELMVRELDDKVRFGQKAVGRPGSGAGRPGSGAGRPGSGAGRLGGISDRPPSHNNSIGEARSVEFMDRPRSRGQTDVWTRPGEDRRGSFQPREDRRGSFQPREDRRGSFHPGEDRRGSFHGGRDRGQFLGNRDYDRPMSRDRW